MTNLNRLLFSQPVALLDQNILSSRDTLVPFALTDTLTAFAEKQQKPILHFWQFSQTMILGMKDTRVPHFSEGIAALMKHNYQPVIRNSGGLGVIADQGVLNLSLILPNPPEHKLTIDRAYLIMSDWIASAFQTKEKRIEAYEISSSYCPGTFDLSIEGKKFAGLAQRRVKNGIAVMAYLSVEGNQLMRGEVVRQFYQAALKDGFGQNGYPAVDPTVMENLGTLIGEELTVAEVKNRLLFSFEEHFGKSLHEEPLESWTALAEFSEDYHKQLEKMVQRNQQLKEETNALFL
ncbi:lipoate--protein ligase family protein [Enterococcus sp. LJL51]|uniref:lipoate--protein ligase family protein n=1 Tax=Enterococcus sp. LJL51 TaxID=3416656 RepID=UPI003CEF9341